MAVPTKDSLLVSWGGNFDTKGTLAPVDFHLTAAQMVAFHAKYLAFKDAKVALDAARESGVRSESMTSAKNACKDDLLFLARELYGFVQDANDVSDAKKIEIGVTPKNYHHAPIPRPTLIPWIGVAKVYGREVTLDIRNPETGKRGRPYGCKGVALYSFIGPVAPSGTAGWQSEGNITRDRIIVRFDEDVEPGTKVWFCGFYYSERGLAGPACTAVGANIGFEGSLPLAE